MSRIARKRLCRLLAYLGMVLAAGCASGPTIKASLSFKQGPSLDITFQAEPSTNSVARAP